MEVIKTDEPNANNNIKDESSTFKTRLYHCPLCTFIANTVSDIEEHAIESHEQCAEIFRRFNEQNSGSIKMLEDVPSCDWILTPEEITHFGVDWKMLQEFIKILGLSEN